MRSVEYQGEWWLPASPENRQKGDFRFSPDKGAELTLNGSLRESTSMPRNVASYPTILGKTTVGNLAVTLVGCIETQAEWGINPETGQPQLGTQRCHARQAFIMDHIEGIEQAKFTKCVVEYSSLPEWVGRSGFSEELPDSDEEETVCRVDYSHPQEIICKTTMGELTITYSFQRRSGESFSELVLNQSTFLVMRPNQPITELEFQKQFIVPYQRFLTLATGRPNYVVSLHLFPVGWDEDNYRLGVEALYQQGKDKVESRKTQHPSDMLFCLSDVETQYDQMIDSWFKLHSDLGPVCDLFFSVQFSPDMYLEGRFLNMVYAAETYHRRRNRREVKLRRRITELLDKTKEAIDPLVSDKNAFIQEVMDTRNYFTHYDVRKERRAARELELYMLAETLSFMLKVCLLLETGVDITECSRILAENNSFENLQKLKQRL